MLKTKIELVYDKKYDKKVMRLIRKFLKEIEVPDLSEHVTTEGHLR